jgi:hypothetical protein
MQRLLDLSHSPYNNRVLATRPDLSLEEEAKVCGVAVGDVAAAWQDLEQAKTMKDYDAAWDRWIKMASMPIAEAAREFGVPQAKYAEMARYNYTRAFIHRGRWRLWRSDFEKELPSWRFIADDAVEHS